MTRRILQVACLGGALASFLLFAADTVPTRGLTIEVATDAGEATLADRLAGLDTLSRELVEDARSARAEAPGFRIRATLYRENLRALVRDNREAGTSARLADADLQARVQMAALLHAAAACQTGRYIVCPADLMQQLTAQQQRVMRGTTPGEASPP